MVMTKETSYQKLKRENKELKEKLQELALRPHSSKSSAIRTSVLMQEQIEKAMFFGSVIDATNRLSGFLERIKKA